MKRRIAFVAIGMVLVPLGATAPRADARREPLPPAYVEECGACHVAFPGRMLDPASWDALIGDLERHFGVDASLDPELREQIRAYLARSAQRRRNGAPPGTDAPRITETRWFRHEHDDVPARVWEGRDAIRPADCAACHRDAATGDFDEDRVRIPARPGETRGARR